MASGAGSVMGRFQYRRSYRLLLLVLVGLLLLSAGFAVTAGPVPIPMETAWKVALHKAFPDWIEMDWSQGRDRIIWDLRFPRVILGFLVGAGLSVVGSALQAATRNPLADPYLFGVSSGAALGAVAVIVHLGDFAGIYSLPIAAFLGALLSLALLLGLTQRQRTLAPERLVLAGVAVSFALMAGTNFLIFLGDQRAAHSVVFWMLGGLGLARWDQLWIPAAAVFGGIAWLYLQGHRMNALLMGEETAVSLGVDVNRFRISLFVVCALMAGVLVALTGAIGFVGLMVPHIVRMVVGGDNRRLLPACALIGGIFLVWVDVLARVTLAPQELPIGIITAALGSVFFMWMMRRGN